MKQIEPDESWDVYDVQLVPGGKCSTFQQGLAKAKMAEEKSDLQTESECDNLSKLKRKKKRPLRYTFNSEDLENVNPEENPGSSKKRMEFSLPTPPPIFMPESGNTSTPKRSTSAFQNTANVGSSIDMRATSQHSSMSVDTRHPRERCLFCGPALTR